MAESTIPVDLFNPGQVFACIGLMELAELLLGEARGGFDWNSEPDTRFHWSAAGDAKPLCAALEFLRFAELVALAPPATQLNCETWNVPTVHVSSTSYPTPTPSSPEKLPVQLRHSQHHWMISYWGDGTRRNKVKFWTGTGGYPGAAIVRDALEALADKWETCLDSPFEVGASQSSSLHFDWRGNYVPLSAGFSRNAHKKGMRSAGFPLVELLAAIGATHARPQRVKASSKLEHLYGVLQGRTLPLNLHRAALGGTDLPFELRRFLMRLDWPAKVNQACVITDVIEIPIDSNPSTSR